MEPQEKMFVNTRRKQKQQQQQQAKYSHSTKTLFLLLLLQIVLLFNATTSTHAISIKPADFDRLIMPCYMGSSFVSPSTTSNQINPTPLQFVQSSGSSSSYSAGNSAYSASQQLGRVNLNGGQQLGSNGPGPSYFGASNNVPDSFNNAASYSSGPSYRDSLSPNLGQQIPRANSIDNFIALVAKIESANPRLANNVDQLIRTLLSRFHNDNYYYDVRLKASISDSDHRADIVPALFFANSNQAQQQQQQPFLLSSDIFPEHLLDQSEKCSMYFMLSHFIDKSTPLNQPLSNTPIQQLTGPQNGQKPPFLQAAGAPYPAQSANQAFGSGSRYPGPNPGFSSPITSNMNGFGSGISNNPDYTGQNAYGQNVAQPNPQLFNQNYNNMRQSGQYSGTLSSNSRYSTPFIDGQGRSRDEKVALEYGVVTVANQDNAALVLNRVLLGLLAASTPAQTIRQLSSMIYSVQSLTNTPKIDEEIDPLFAVTLADLWAISSIPKSGRQPYDVRLLGNNGRWNDTMCPTTFQLDRSSSIRFTTAELIGGLDGFNLGMFRRRLMGLRKNIRLSELLRIYYSKNGFRPQFAEVGVCNRASALTSQLDDLHRQAENYLRLYQLNLPTTDQELSQSINRLDSFKDFARQAANQYAPQDICQDSSFASEAYPTGAQDQCELPKVDLSVVVDSSPQANNAFMNLAVAKLAQKLGLSRYGNSLSVLTNQQDSTGYAGGYSFNAIVRNSTNTAEIGCALMYDSSRTYQGGQVTDPTRLVEMFERTLVNLDSEFLVRQTTNNGDGHPSSSSPSSSYSYRAQPTYVSSLFNQNGASDNYNYMSNGAGSKNTAGSKVIVWFNYGNMPRANPLSSSPTNWQAPGYGGNNYNSEQFQQKFQEAKRYLRENFRGASVLAVATSRDDVKAFVYDDQRDVFTDIPPGNGAQSSDYYPSTGTSQMDSATISLLNGPADQLVTKLLQRMCDIPAVFQYPMCYRAPSENAISVGYISPGRRQYWMMSPKTFFASKTVRIAFKVDGGRLKVCFGRMSNPEQSAVQYNQQQYGSQSGAILLSNGVPASNNNNNGNPASQTVVSSSSNYYTGLTNGVCKDVSPNQEIDFIIEDPCYKKAIAECEPFYFIIRETSNPGEGDLNYMCKDEGCTRLDQAKFTMTHTGVTCSSAFKSVKANWLLIMISIMVTIGITNTERRHFNMRTLLPTAKHLPVYISFISVSLYLSVQQVHAQQAAPHDFGQGRYGERRGNFTPSEIVAIILLIMTILAGLALTIGLCYYVTKRNKSGMSKVEQDDY